MPHSRCNCRCVMCDIWKANHLKKEISVDELNRHLEPFKKLGVREVALSGGEALLHTNLWKFCEGLKSIGVKISLLSTGIALKNNATEIVKYCKDVIVSLDGSRNVHNQIRNIPLAYEKLAEGVDELKNVSVSFRITGRCVLQKQNFRDFFNIIRSAKEIGLDQISFLAADVTSPAFNHTHELSEEKKHEISLNLTEADELEELLKISFVELKKEYKNNFIAESPTKMLSLVQHYRAGSGLGKFPKKKCNAPWVSAVIESDGNVHPCFFHPAYGNIYEKNFMDILNSEKAVLFRKQLEVAKDPVCQRCVCSLYK